MGLEVGEVGRRVVGLAVVGFLVGDVGVYVDGLNVVGDFVGHAPNVSVSFVSYLFPV